MRNVDTNRCVRKCNLTLEGFVCRFPSNGGHII